MDKFRYEMCAQVERGDLEDSLLQTADTHIDQRWTCTICKSDNPYEALMCAGCTGCKIHGEQECKACRNKIQAQQQQQQQQGAPHQSSRTTRV